MSGRLAWAALAVLVLAGNAALLGALAGRTWALQAAVTDRTGALFECGPTGFRHTPTGVRLNLFEPRETAAALPPRSGDPSGLGDLAAGIRFARATLRVGAFYPDPAYRLDELLGAAADTSRRFYCGSYSRLLGYALRNMGYPVRVVALEGHITTEAWLPALRQWVLCDAVYDFVAYVPGGRPLSLVAAMKRLRAGEAVEWRPVVGAEEDDDDMDPATRRQVEGILRRGRGLALDGLIAHARRSDLERAMGLSLGRVRGLQLDLDGSPAPDRAERRLRFAWALWNAAGLAGAGLLLARRGAHAPSGQSRSPSGPPGAGPSAVSAKPPGSR